MEWFKCQNVILTVFVLFQLAIQLPGIGVYAAYGIFGLGSILLFMGTVVTLTKKWNTYTDLDDELTR